MKAGGEEEEIQEATVSLAAAAAAKDISIDAAVEPVLSELGGIFAYKEEKQRLSSVEKMLSLFS